jgi:TonB family protein
MLFSPTKSVSSFLLLFFMVLTAEASSFFKDQLYRIQNSSLEDIIGLELADACSQTISDTEFGKLNRELLVDTTKVVYDVVEIQPSPPGGMAGWNKYLMENLRYPPDAQRKGIEGTVIVAFVVNTDGTTTDIEILRSVGGGCDEEVIRIVQGSPKWTPGMQRGTPVRTRMRLPLRFMLGGTDPSRDSTEVSLNAVPLPPTDGQDSTKENSAVFFDLVDTPPSPVGGLAAWQRHLSDNLTYPTSARMRGIQGTVLVSFIVNTDGSIEGIELVQGIGGGCDEEAIHIIKISPRWTPGMIKGKAVRTRMKIPISFKLG